MNPDELRNELPDSFYQRFSEPAERECARRVVEWARNRGLRFYRKSASATLETWQAVVSEGGRRHHLLSLQPRALVRGERAAPRAHGQPDVPFKWMDTGFFADRGNRLELLDRLHAVLPHGKPFDPDVVDRYWPFTWRALAGSGRIDDFLAVFDWAVERIRSNAAPERHAALAAGPEAARST